MEWKYLDVEPPKSEGQYLTLSLSGRVTVNNYGHICKRVTKEDGHEFYMTGYIKDLREINNLRYNYFDVGSCFYTQQSRTPIKRIVMWCEIPPIPADVDERSTKIRRCEMQIKELREKIKALKEGKEEA